MKQSYLRGFFWVSVVLITTLWITSQRQYSFNYDSQNKLFQAYSLVANGFRSEALVYPGQDFDPEGLFDPQPYTFVLEDGRKVGAFPLPFAALATPFVLLDRCCGFGLEYAALLSLLPLLGIWLLFLYWRLPPVLLLMAFWGNFLWLQAFELSEYLLAAFFSAAGLTLLFRTDDSNQRNRHPLLAGLLVGLSILFRHEALAFGLSLTAAMLMIGLLQQRKVEIRRGALFAAGFLCVVAGWALWNTVDYGHVLGPRFLVNRDGQFPGIAETLHRYRVLYFGGGLKFGIFAFMPLLLAPLFEPLVRFRSKRHFAEIVIHLTVVVYLIGVPLFVPNDGAGGYGPRYLIFAVFPGFILIKEWMQRHPKPPVFLIFAILSLPLPAYLHKAQQDGTIQQKTVQAEYSKVQADIWVYPGLPHYYYAGLDTIRQESYLAPSTEATIDLVHRLKKNRPGKAIAIVSLSTEMAESAERNLAGKDSELARRTLRIVQASLRDVDLIRRHFPDLTLVKGQQVDIMLLPASSDR